MSPALLVHSEGDKPDVTAEEPTTARPTITTTAAEPIHAGGDGHRISPVRIPEEEPTAKDIAAASPPARSSSGS